MTRHYVLKDWVARRPEVIADRLRREAHLHRVGGNRPRDPEAERVLTLLVKERWRRALETGAIEVLGPRHFRINPGGLSRL